MCLLSKDECAENTNSRSWIHNIHLHSHGMNFLLSFIFFIHYFLFHRNFLSLTFDFIFLSLIFFLIFEFRSSRAHSLFILTLHQVWSMNIHFFLFFCLHLCLDIYLSICLSISISLPLSLSLSLSLLFHLMKKCSSSI